MLMRPVHVLWYNMYLGCYFGMILQYVGMKFKLTNFLLVQNSFFSQLNIILNFHSKILSQNIAPKDMSKSHETNSHLTLFYLDKMRFF